jgi:hypothetical protein
MKIALAVVLALLVASSLLAQDAERDTAIYVEKYEDPVLKEIKEAAETLADEAARKTEEILAKALEDKEQRKSQRRQLRFDLGHIVRPEGPQAFTTRLWHFPPTPQYRTGTCWSFSTTSFLETEIQRQSRQGARRDLDPQGVAVRPWIAVGCRAARAPRAWRGSPDRLRRGAGRGWPLRSRPHGRPDQRASRLVQGAQLLG